MVRQPTVFFGHGSPMIAMVENDTTRTWRGIMGSMPRPRAILCISAHWVTRGIGVTAQQNPPTIHDFGNFPRAMHEMQYPAPGEPALVRRIAALLAPDIVHPSNDWGFDHGCWTVLMKMLPAADVPVVQLSLDVGRSAAEHFALGRRLAPLRDEGVLIMGTGNIVHNMGGVVRRDDAPPCDYAVNFTAAIKQAIVADEPARFINYQRLGADALRSVPTPDHYWPLLYVMGARHPEDEPSFATDFVEMASIGMTSVILRAPVPPSMSLEPKG